MGKKEKIAEEQKLRIILVKLCLQIDNSLKIFALHFLPYSLPFRRLTAKC